MMNNILDRINAGKLRLRLPFYVQLAHACPEDIGDLKSQNFVTAVLELVRTSSDFLQWKHPVKRSARQGFVLAFSGSKEPETFLEREFADWLRRCRRPKTSSEPPPPYEALFSSMVHLLDRYSTPEIDRDWQKDSDGWFEDICRKGHEICEQAFLTEWDFRLFCEEVEGQFADEIFEEIKQIDIKRKEQDEEDRLVLMEREQKKFNDFDSDDFGKDEYEIEGERFVDDFGNDN